MTRPSLQTLRHAALLAALLSPIGLAACSGAQAETDQSKLCIFSNDEQAKKCKPDELAYFSPGVWGSAQMPLNVIATYCNTNRPVQFNEAGVVCTFTDKRLWLLKAEK